MLLFRRTLAAFADTIVPEDDGPGGAAVGALDLYADPFYRARSALAPVALHLNLHAWLRHGKSFAALGLPERTKIVLACEGSRLLRKAYEGLTMLTKLAFYGGLISRDGHTYMGYPGANDGYPDAGHAKVVEGDTVDGNFP